LPRLAVWLLVIGAVFFTTLATGVATTESMQGRALPAASLLGALYRLGPPIANGMLPALAGWLPGATLPSDLGATLVRGALWAALGIGTLAAAFRRIELK
jgi:hypothetical protein